MTLIYSAVGLKCEIYEDSILTIVIENPCVFQNFIMDLYCQQNGGTGDIFISDNCTPVDIKKKTELLSQFIPFEVNQKDLITKLYANLKSISVDENNYLITQEILSGVSKYIYSIIEDFESDIIFDIPEDIGGILKAFNVRFNDENLTLSEKIIEYMSVVNELKGQRIFFLVNLRSYLTDKQIEELYKTIVLKKITVISIENIEHERVNNEKIVIIDKDMCII